MSSARQQRIRTADEWKRFQSRPAIEVDGRHYQLDETMPLHQLALKRMAENRDLKILVTATNSQTGVGKTTCAGYLALNWTWMFGGERWDSDNYGTVDPYRYFQLVHDVNKGIVLLVDDAEELDARRSMADLNVKFSWWWELMRLRQLITIVTLPSPAAIDSRIEELADVWINVLRRGEALVHGIGVQDYGNRNVYTKKVHHLRFPDVSDHPAMQGLEEKKEEKMDKYEQEAADEVADNNEIGLSKTSQTFLAVAKKEQHSAPWKDVPDLDERLEYSGEFYRSKSKELLN